MLNKVFLLGSIGGLGMGMIFFGGVFLFGEFSFGIGFLFGGGTRIIGLSLMILLFFILDKKERKEKIQKQFEA